MFIRSHSAISAIITVHFTTLSIDEPTASSVRLMFSIVCRVSASIPPGTTVPAAEASVPICPERKIRSPTRTAGEKGRVGAPNGVRYSTSALAAEADAVAAAVSSAGFTPHPASVSSAPVLRTIREMFIG